jgi:hypothetical protein
MVALSNLKMAPAEMIPEFLKLNCFHLLGAVSFFWHYAVSMRDALNGSTYVQ